MSSILDLVPDSHTDLLRQPLVATLTTLARDGRPTTTAVWFLLTHDGDLVSSVTSDRQKYRNLSRDPRCSLFVIDPSDPLRTLEVRADADLVADPDYTLVSELARAYGADPAGFAAAGKQRFTLVYRPVKVVASPAVAPSANQT